MPRPFRNADLRLSKRWLLTSVLLLCVGGCAPKPPGHGTAFIVVLDTNNSAAIQESPQSLARTEEVLRRRLHGLGVSFFVEPGGGERLIIKVRRSGSNQLDLVRKVISTAGILEFRMVHPDSAMLIDHGIVEPGYEVLKEQRVWTHGKTGELPYLVNKKPERGLSSKHIKKATVTRNRMTRQPEIAFELDTQGARLFEEITTEYQPKGGRFYQLAIVFDGKIYAAPRINGVISGGRGMISSSFSMNDALVLASVLENPAETPHRIIEERTF